MKKLSKGKMHMFSEVLALIRKKYATILLFQSQSPGSEYYFNPLHKRPGISSMDYQSGKLEDFANIDGYPIGAAGRMGEKVAPD